MDIVTDLTAEAVSYLSLFQDILKSNPDQSYLQKFANRKWNELTVQDLTYHNLTPNQCSRIKDLLWHSPTKVDSLVLSSRYFETVLRLLKWLSAQINFFGKSNALASVWFSYAVPGSRHREPIIFRSPYFWREQIRSILYKNAQERLELSIRLQYMPLQVILVLAGKGKTAYYIRLYQFYKLHKNDSVVEADSTDYADILSNNDCSTYIAWWKDKSKDAERFLKDDHLLLHELKLKEFPLPFETFFRDELIEIAAAREARYKEWNLVDLNYKAARVQDKSSQDTDGHKSDAAAGKKDPYQNKEIFDPLVKAEEMQLMGIALSGGGIRSATFNLGILQRLANLNVLHRFDYISTVSGGGYIGTWFNSWIKRTGSFSKVNDRLNPQKSGDPLADEVRPIRWLRMFSNYLSPNVGIMSPDAWASGMTWIRNTVINQIVLMLTLVTILSLIEDIYAGWQYLTLNVHEIHSTSYLFWATMMLVPGALLIAFAMRSFHTVDNKALKVEWPQIIERLKISLSQITNVTTLLPQILVLWCSLCAMLLITYFAATCGPSTKTEVTKVFIYVSCSAFAAFAWIATWGNYHKRSDLMQIGMANVQGSNENHQEEISAVTVIAIIISSLIACLSMTYLLGISWMSMDNFYFVVRLRTGLDPDKVLLVIGIPIILEIFSIAVVIRMALMGKLFPEYRREWWSRMGGFIHRFALSWIVITFASLLMPGLWLKMNPFNWTLPVAWGGWAGIVGWGVKKAFESKDETGPRKNTTMSLILKVIPYIFMIGVLLIGSWLCAKIRTATQGKFNYDIYITLLLAAITLVLSWRIGVNEFSLHHFYRNRLIRAFMGATRSREDRVKTANAFTGFDTNDDILLSSMRVNKGYFGPFPIINSALNATVVFALDRQDRKAESFVFSPLYCGYDFSPTRPSTYDVDHVYEYGYRPTDEFANKNGGPTIGTAMAISGAAVNPNWGYHSSPVVAFLLTMFNIRLGWWIGNTRLDKWKNSDPNFGLLYLMRDLIGKSDINMDYVCLSDGGHFDNMGLYELVRRRCHYILIGDGEQDQDGTCEGLANAIRRCRIDFGVEINIDITAIVRKPKDKFSEHLVKGEIIYPGTGKVKGTLIYIKSTLSGNEPVDIREYAMAHEDFPHESTGDQFFDEAQFESYRKLGYHSIRNLKSLHIS